MSLSVKKSVLKTCNILVVGRKGVVDVLVVFMRHCVAAVQKLQYIIYFLCVVITPTDGGLPWHGDGAYGHRGSCRFHFLGIQRGGDY